eukprot:Nitzschia sp. Nitz4//scaffold53_size117307//5678//7118//NITZ4_003752-RA/size117307-exonerate_est2genome-gene-0.90-mRNA-1//-1//CDS//3329554151//6539//frame0
MTYEWKDARISMKMCFYIPFFVAPLSMLSSSYIAYQILQKENRPKLRKSARDQLLLGMSFLDILASFGLSFSTIPGPEESINTELRYNYPRFGNVQTCEAQAFFVHMGVGVPWYNAAICIYYVLSIRYNVSDRKVVKWFVPIVHSVIMLWTFSTAITGLLLDVFNFAGLLGCWVGSAKQLCGENETYCNRGRYSTKFEQAVVMIPVSLALAIVLFSMFLVYVTVRRIEANSNRWDISRRTSASIVNVSLNSGLPQSEVHDASEVTDSRTSPQRHPSSLTRRTMRSCLLYSGAFLLVYIPIGLSNVIGGVHPAVHWSIRVLSALCFPLQGFFNMLIFTSNVWVPAMQRRWHRIRFCGKLTQQSSHEGQGALSAGNDVTSTHFVRRPVLGDTTLPSVASSNGREVTFSQLPELEPVPIPQKVKDPYQSKSLPPREPTVVELTIPGKKRFPA